MRAGASERGSENSVFGLARVGMSPLNVFVYPPGVKPDVALTSKHLKNTWTEASEHYWRIALDVICVDEFRKVFHWAPEIGTVYKMYIGFEAEEH